jgi:O-Antigen ligase
MEFLQYFSFALPFLSAVILAFGVCLVILALSSNYRMGVVVVLLAAFVKALLVREVGFQLGVNLYPMDLVFICIAPVVILRFIFRPSNISSRLPALWVSLVLILSLSLVIGLVRNGVAAGNDFRHYFYFLACATYFASFQTSESEFETAEKVWIAFAVALALLATVRWVSDAAGITSGPSWDMVGSGVKFRVLGSDQALGIASGLILLIDRSLRSGVSWGDKLLIGFLGAEVLVLQHRSVWAATAVGLLALFLLSKRSERKKLLVGAMWAASIGIVLSPFILYGSLESVTSALLHSVEEVGARKSTISGRIEGWDVLLDQWRGFAAWEKVIGQPFGGGYERYLAEYGRVIRDSPHNYYVQTLLRAGVIGGVVLVSLLVSTLLGLRKRFSANPQYGQFRVLFGLITMNAAYFLAYGGSFEQGIFFGLTLALLSNHGFSNERVVPGSRNVHGNRQWARDANT